MSASIPATNDKNLKYEIETLVLLVCYESILAATNDKNLKYEIETRCKSTSEGVPIATNDKNLKYEIETINAFGVPLNELNNQ